MVELKKSNFEMILKQATKSSDIHDTICETTKFATSIANVCQFEITYDQFSLDWGIHRVQNGSFSYNSNEDGSETKIKCFQPVQLGFTLNVINI